MHECPNCGFNIQEDNIEKCPNCSFNFNYLLFFFKRLRDKLTCSGLISLIFNLLIISSDIKVWTASYGVLLFKIVLLVEFMWEAMRSQSSCVKLLKEEYLQIPICQAGLLYETLY